MKNRIVLFICVILLVISGCAKDYRFEVQNWDNFQDAIFKVSFTYPKDWYIVKESNRIAIYNSMEVAEKFFTRDPRKPDGVQIIIASEKSDTMQNYEKYIDAYTADQEAAGFKIKGVSNSKIEGLTAKQVTFVGIVEETQKTKLNVTRIATLKDSVIYYIQYSGFNKTFDPNKFILDTILATLTLPKKIVIEKGVDPAIPIAQVEKYIDNFLQLEYPANFAPSDLPKKGDVVGAIRFQGKLEGNRRDCTIDIDVRPAKGLNLDKVVEQNSKFFKFTSKGNAVIGGEKATFLNYSLVKGVDSRVYFVVKNDKIFRIILNYYAPMKKDFLPAFEKVVASIRFK